MSVQLEKEIIRRNQTQQQRRLSQMPSKIVQMFEPDWQAIVVEMCSLKAAISL